MKRRKRRNIFSDLVDLDSPIDEGDEGDDMIMGVDVVVVVVDDDDDCGCLTFSSFCIMVATSLA